MTIIVDDFLIVREFQNEWSDFKAIDSCKLNALEVGMEVKVRRFGENFRIRVDDINGDIVTGIVLTDIIYFSHPFTTGDTIQFKKENIINIYDINRWGVKL